MWDAILDIGRPESSADMLASAQKAFDAVRFDEQMSRVRRHFSGLDTDARKTASAVEQLSLIHIYQATMVA